MARCPPSASAPDTCKSSSCPENRHDRQTRSRPFAPMDRPQHPGLRHRHRATGEGPARHFVHGNRRSQAGRCRAMDRALVPGAAGFSDVGTRPRRPSHPRRLPAAGAAAAPDVGRRRTRILRRLARRRRGDADLAHRRRDHEDRQHRRAVLRLRRPSGDDAARHRAARAAGYRLSRHVDHASSRPPSRPRRRPRQNTAKPTWPIPCCCFAIRR